MKRKLFTLAAALSLVLGVATAVLWVRSYFVLDVLWLRGPGHVNAVGVAGRPIPTSWQRFGVFNSRGGELGVMWWVRYNQRISDQPAGGWLHNADPNPIPATLAGQTWAGFHYHVGARPEDRSTSLAPTAPPPMTSSHTLGVPYWFIAIILLAPAVIWMRVELRRRRLDRCRKQNRCPACGYDLRASPNRCPECGTRVNPKSEASA